MPDMFHMHTDLMSASGFRFDSNQRNLSVGPLSGKMCHGRVAFFEIHASFNDRVCGTTDWRINSAVFWSNTVTKCQIFLLNQFLLHCFGQDRSGKHVFCQKCDTGGIPVQPCDTAEGIGNPLRGIIPQHAICQRLFIMIHRRMNWHICRFVNDQNVLILI